MRRVQLLPVLLALSWGAPSLAQKSGTVTAYASSWGAAKPRLPAQLRHAAGEARWLVGQAVKNPVVRQRVAELAIANGVVVGAYALGILPNSLH